MLMKAKNEHISGKFFFFCEHVFFFNSSFHYRREILIYLEKVAQRYIFNICQRKKLPIEECKNAGGKVLTYGSYSLGVHSRGI